MKERLAKLHRTENLRICWKKTKKARIQFYRNPFRFMKNLFTEEKSISFKIPKKEFESHIKRNMNENRLEKGPVLSDIPPLPKIECPFDDSLPKLSEIIKVTMKAWEASAPGLNGIPYRIYKGAPDVLKLLWKQMRILWKKQTIQKSWRRAGGILITREKNAKSIDQFRQISLLNVEGKIFLWCGR